MQTSIFTGTPRVSDASDAPLQHVSGVHRLARPAFVPGITALTNRPWPAHTLQPGVRTGLLPLRTTLN